MAGLQERNKAYDKAVAILTEGLADHPDHPTLLSDRGQLYAAMKDFDRAFADLDRAIEVAPERAQAYHGRGSAYIQRSAESLKRPGGAMESASFLSKAGKDLDRAIQLDAGLADAYRLRALVRLYQMDYDLAWKDVRACRQRGGSPSASFIRELERVSGKKDEHLHSRTRLTLGQMRRQVSAGGRSVGRSLAGR